MKNNIINHAKVFINYDEETIIKSKLGTLINRPKIEIRYKSNIVQSFYTKDIDDILYKLLNTFNQLAWAKRNKNSKLNKSEWIRLNGFTWKKSNLGSTFEWNKIKTLCGYPVKVSGNKKNKCIKISIRYDITKINFSEVIEDFKFQMKNKYGITIFPQAINTGCTMELS